MSNIPTINSGVVHAPGALSDSNDPSSPTNAAPSQASQDLPPPQAKTTETGPRHQSAPLHPASQQGINPQDPHHQLNKHAYEIGTGTGRQRPFPAMSEGQHGVAGGEAPPLPPRDGDGGVEGERDGVRSERRHPSPHSTVGEQPHIAGLHRGDYASGAHPHNTTTEHTAPLAPGLGNASHGGTQGRTTAENPFGTSRHSTGEKVHEGASGVKGIVAAVHGAGEALRGTFNREVDRAFHDKAGEIKNDQIAREGEAEITEGRFAPSTKNRDGVVPGADHGERREQAF